MGVPPPKPLQTGKSVENNADIFAAFTALAAIESQLGGQADFDWRSEGLICRLSVPLMQEAAPRPINGRQNQAVNGNGAELASRSADA